MEFRRDDTPTVMDGIVVRYKLSGVTGQISASRNGVCVSGYFPVMPDGAVASFLETFHEALVQYRSIRDTGEPLAESEANEARVRFLTAACVGGQHADLSQRE